MNIVHINQKNKLMLWNKYLNGMQNDILLEIYAIFAGKNHIVYTIEMGAYASSYFLKY